MQSGSLGELKSQFLAVLDFCSLYRADFCLNMVNISMYVKLLLNMTVYVFSLYVEMVFSQPNKYYVEDKNLYYNMRSSHRLNTFKIIYVLS
jgi:hypothetical protein